MTAQEFKDARAELGWTQSATAEALGVSLRTIKYYEAGTVPISRPVGLLLSATLDLTRRLNATAQT